MSLISRKACIDRLRRIAGNQPNKMMRDLFCIEKFALERMPEIKAVPVEWLEKGRRDADDAGDIEMRDAITHLLGEWEKIESLYVYPGDDKPYKL